MRSQGIPPSRSSSTNQVGGRSWSPSTIRCVQSQDDVFQDHQDAGHDVYIPDSPKSVIHHQLFSGSMADVTGSDVNPWSCPAAEDDTSHALAHAVAPENKGSKQISHRSSAFFASPNCHLFRTTSPYRRVLQETIKQSQATPKTILSSGSRPFSSLSNFSLPMRYPSPNRTEDDIHMNTSESVYSFTTEPTQQNYHSNEFPLEEEHSASQTTEKHGNATIFLADFNYQPKTSPARNREISSTSSVEWKTWLSANVAKLENRSILQFEGNYMTMPHTASRSGHVREEAEIDSGDAMTLDHMQTPVTCHSPTLSPARTYSGAVFAQNQTDPVGKLIPFVTDENSAPSLSSGAPKPPVIPVFSSLRTRPSLPCVRTKVIGNTCREVDPLPRMRSLNTLTKSSPVAKELLLKRRTRGRVGARPFSPATPSPGLTAAVERQFGRAIEEPRCMNTVQMGDSSARQVGVGVALSSDDTDPSRSLGSESGAQAMGSRTMVDLFLSSRRRKIVGSGSVTGSESSLPAFL